MGEAAGEVAVESQLAVLLAALDQEAALERHGQVASVPAERQNQQLPTEMEEVLQALYHLVRFFQGVPKVERLEAKSLALRRCSQFIILSEALMLLAGYTEADILVL